MDDAACAAAPRARGDLRSRGAADGSGPVSTGHGAQRLALDELHRDEAAASTVADVVDGDDVRMVERRRGARSRSKRRPLGVAAVDPRAEELERDVAAEPRVVRAIDLAHAAAPDQRQHLIGADGR